MNLYSETSDKEDDTPAGLSNILPSQETSQINAFDSQVLNSFAQADDIKFKALNYSLSVESDEGSQKNVPI